MVGKYQVITLCDNIRFKNEFMMAQKRLTLEVTLSSVWASLAIREMKKYGRTST